MGLCKLQIYATPIYEAFETRFARLDESCWSPFNMVQRLITRGTYIALTTFVAMLLPFFGDFVALTGSISALPLDFVLVLCMHVVVGPLTTPIMYRCPVVCMLLHSFTCGRDFAFTSF